MPRVPAELEEDSTKLSVARDMATSIGRAPHSRWAGKATLVAEAGVTGFWASVRRPRKPKRGDSPAFAAPCNRWG